MSKRTHIIYIAIIAVLSLAVAFGVVIGFRNAESMISPQLKSYSATDFMGQHYLTFQGVWKIDGEKSDLKHPYLYKCNSRDMVCEVSDAHVWGNYLTLNAETFAIKEWNGKQMVIEEVAFCRTNTIVVDLLSEQVTMVTKNVPNRDMKACEAVPYLSAPRKSELIDGLEESFKKK